MQESLWVPEGRPAATVCTVERHCQIHVRQDRFVFVRCVVAGTIEEPVFILRQLCQRCSRLVILVKLVEEVVANAFFVPRAAWLPEPNLVV